MNKKVFRKLWRAVLLFFLLGAIVWIGFLAFRTVHLVQNAKTSLDNVKNGQFDLAQAKDAIKSASQDLSDIKSGLGPVFPVLNLFTWIPGIGPSIGQVEPLVSLGSGLARASDLLIGVFEPVLQADSGGVLTVPERLSKAIQDSGTTLDEADRLLKTAALDAAKIDPQLLPAQFQETFSRVQPFLPALPHAIPALKQIPSLMGKDQRQDYLVLAQNRDELRATGGFITGIGTVSLEKGKLTSVTIGDSYAIDDFTKKYPAPPAPLKVYMKADYWVTRDGNWSPDFPTSAAQVQSLYSLSTGLPTGGVIAFDQLAIKGLLNAIGPVRIDSYPNPISADSVEEFMRQAWAPDPAEGVTGKWWANRKQFMGDLGRALVLRLLANASDQKKTADLLIQVGELVHQGHLLMNFNQIEFNSLLKSIGMDGSVDPGPGDYLFLVDSNIGFNKVDTVIKRDITYEVNLADVSRPVGTVTVHYQHTIQQQVPCKHEPTYGKGTYADMQARCYWDYWRLYRPTGSTLGETKIAPVPASYLLTGQNWSGQVDITTGESQTSVFGGLLVLPPASQGSFSITNLLPQSVLRQEKSGTWEYFLRIPKQAGLDALPVSLSVQLPAGMVLSVPPAGWTQAGSGKWAWKGKLTMLQDFTLTFGQQ